MRNKGILVKAAIGAVLLLGLVGAAPALAAHVAGTKVKIQRNIAVLNGQNQTVYVNVQVTRTDTPLQGHPRVTVDFFEHRAQNEDRPADSSYGHQFVHVPGIGTIRNYDYEVDDGKPCRTCGAIDTVCELIGDRC